MNGDSLAALCTPPHSPLEDGLAGTRRQTLAIQKSIAWRAAVLVEAEAMAEDQTCYC